MLELSEVVRSKIDSFGDTNMCELCIYLEPSIG